MQLATFLAAIVTAVSAIPNYGYYPISLCAFNASQLAAFTSNAFTATPSTTTWAGKPLAASESCPTPLTPTIQHITVSSFSRAQTNIDPWVPRSNTYALSIFRSASVAKAHLDMAITDASGKTVVPRIQVALPGSTANTASSPLIATRRSNPNPVPRRGKRSTKGRRKGKGGVMGGIGGGGRYGGGSGGFRSSTPGGSTKTYGFSNSAIRSRYASSYSRTSYGYSGRSTVFVGAPMFLYARGGGHYYSQGCNRYTGSARLQCLGSYNGTTNSEGLNWKASSALMRDDLMTATVDAKNVTFPLTITIYKVAVVFNQGALPMPWDQTLMLTFSEVDLDDEEDVVMEFWVFCLLIGLATLCFCGCCFWFWWPCNCCRSSESEGDDSNSYNKEVWDPENPKESYPELQLGDLQAKQLHIEEFSTPRLVPGYVVPGHPVEVKEHAQWPAHALNDPTFKVQA